MDPGSLLEEALELLDEACSYDCLEEECRRLATVLETAGEALSETGIFGLKPILATLIGFLEFMVDDATGRGCTAEAALIRGAIAKLKLAMALTP